MTTKHEIGKLEKSLGYLAWNLSFGAVLDVFDENTANEKEEPVESIKANSDQWANSSTLRRHIFNRAKDFWCLRAGLDHTWFPLSEDAVVRMYMRIRKRSADEVEAFRKEIHDAKFSGSLFDNQE